MDAPKIDQWLINFAAETIIKYDMDESHGMDHFLAVANNAKLILKEFAGVQIIPGYNKSQEERVIIDAAFAHDLIDRKYIPADGKERLIAEFYANNYTDTDAVIKIISDMPFSARVKQFAATGQYVPVGKYQLATEIVADADQLDAYKPGRCLAYQTRFFDKNPEQMFLPPESRDLEIRRATKHILCDRVLKYKAVYLKTATAKMLAEPLHRELAIYVEKNFSDV